MFEIFDAAELVEAGFHQYLYETIKTEQVSYYQIFLIDCDLDGGESISSGECIR